MKHFLQEISNIILTLSVITTMITAKDTPAEIIITKDIPAAAVADITITTDERRS